MAQAKAFLFWFIAFFLPFDWALKIYLYANHLAESVAVCFAAPVALSLILVALMRRN